ncbi:MAG: xylulokinase [Chloroflexi bacterium]|jgi:xylulokinase|nr:xylulokinase [Chloroflexota bacterium]MBT5476337.1 xylulokinase [Chloroflexota bacterium]MBT7077864.1 xylulokinase [Chloroflexota bacterium]
MTQPTFLGIDIGTSSIKVVAVDPNGKLLAVASSPMPVDVQRPGWSEQNPEDWWTGTCSAIRQALSEIESPEVVAVGLSGQMHSLVSLDSSLNVVRPAILWNDVRSSAEAAYVRETVGNESLRRLAGNPSLEGFTVSKLLWMRNHEPQLFEKISHMLLAKDYVRFRLTGELATDPSDASATLLFDIVNSRWSGELCSMLGLDLTILPPIVESTGIVARVTSVAATATGLTAGVPVVGGGADNACAAVGAGVVSSGDVLFSVGTSGTVVAPISEPSTDPAMRIHSMRHAVPDTWYLMGVVLSAGAALDWWRRSSGQATFDALVSEASEVEAGSGGVTFLPYLNGERTPHADANARGVFFGMHGGTERAHMTRAVMEGVSFALRDSMELMNELEVNPSEAVVVGGGASSSMWLQMLSDVVDLSLRTVGPSEGAPLGAAMLAAAGSGAFGDVVEAGHVWLTELVSVEPCVALKGAYDDAYGRYRALYPVLQDVFPVGSGVES